LPNPAVEESVPQTVKSISTRAWGAAVGLAAAVAVGGQSRALGGGVGWWSWEHGTVVVGEEATGVAPDVRFDSINQAEDAVRRQNFDAYLVPGRFPVSSVVPVDGDAPALGRVRVFGRDGNSVRVRGSFEVPSVPAGSYTVVFCDRGCDRPLGDLVPAVLRIVEERADLSIGQRIGRAVGSLEEDLRQSARRSHVAQMNAMERLNARVHELARRAAERIERPDPGANRWVPLACFALGGAIAAVVVSALERRRGPTRARRHAVDA
jgi:hypothetical protein